MLRPYLAVRLYEGLSGLMLLTLLLVTGIAQLRNKPFAIRIPFIVGTLALGGLFRGIDEGNSSLFWFGLGITVVLLPLIPEAVRRRPSTG